MADRQRRLNGIQIRIGSVRRLKPDQSRTRHRLLRLGAHVATLISTGLINTALNGTALITAGLNCTALNGTGLISMGLISAALEVAGTIRAVARIQVAGKLRLKHARFEALVPFRPMAGRSRVIVMLGWQSFVLSWIA
ncbi:hypothetical protein [Kibdelosporangium philippinense]